MAGTMPQQRGGSNATTIGMIVSIIVSVLLLGVLIWLITQQEQLRTRADQAQAARRRLAEAGDEAAAKQLFPDSGQVGKTVVGEMLKGVQMLSTAVSGNKNDSPGIAREKLNAVLKRIRREDKVSNPEAFTVSAGAVAVVEALYQQYLDERGLREQAETGLARASDDLKAAQAAHEELQQKVAADLDQLKARVDELQQAKSEFERIKQGETQALAAQIAAKQDAMNALRRQQTDVRRQLLDELGHRESLLNEQREALAALRGPGPEAAQELAIARSAVGHVARALPGHSLVHIDLGRENGVRLGMSFAVYSGDEPIPSDGRGKANIEVVSVGRVTSECRVITPPAPDNPIIEGDRVGNIVLARNQAKKQRFCIVGQFDIDFDGQPDIRGAEAIAALVRRHGGKIVQRVDALTDYVVVGVEPPMTAAPFSGINGSGSGITDEEPVAPPPVDEPDAGDDADEFGDEGDAGDDDFFDDDSADDEIDGGDDDFAEDDFADEEEDGGEEDFADDGDDDEGPGDEEDEAFDDEEDDAADAGIDEDVTAPSTPSAAPSVPRLPSLTRAAEIDPTRAPRLRRALTERERYDEAILRARLLSIPRLPQDRFFNFIGLESGPAAARALEQ